METVEFSLFDEDVDTGDEPFDALVASANAAMVVVTAAAGAQRAGCLVGFHGQSETAAIELAHLREIRGDRAWTLVSVQELNRYRKELQSGATGPAPSAA